MNRRPPLSETDTGDAWLRQFKEADRFVAAALLDALLLLNDEQVSTALRSLLRRLADERSGKRRHVGLYVEREFDEGQAFETQLLPDAKGVVRRRAVGMIGPAPVKSDETGRIGSEGWMAFIISQAVKTSPDIYLNNPGPDLIRSMEVGTLVIVTDFIGSGTRIRTMLDKFWDVPTVRSWMSRGWVDFKIVAAAGTKRGLRAVRDHRVSPEVLVRHVVRSLSDPAEGGMVSGWRTLLKVYGPKRGGGTGRTGFRGSAALVAFSYGMPNNTPPIFTTDVPGRWRALYSGAAPDDIRESFGQDTDEVRVQRAASAVGVELAPDISIPDAEDVLVLSAIGGRWRSHSETALAELTGLTEQQVLDVGRRVRKKGLIDANGRLTDEGQKTLGAGMYKERKRPDIPTNSKPYYPRELRTPRGRSSTSRSSERPR